MSHQNEPYSRLLLQCVVLVVEIHIKSSSDVNLEFIPPSVSCDFVFGALLMWNPRIALEMQFWDFKVKIKEVLFA